MCYAKNNYQYTKEIIAGIITFKNFKNKIKHNCNNSINYINKPKFLLKFENCAVETLNNIFYNKKIVTFEKTFIPNIIITENNTIDIDNIKLETHFIKQEKHEESLKKFVTLTYVQYPITIILTTCIIYTLINKFKKKTIVDISSVPQSNDGGVTVDPINIKFFKINYYIYFHGNLQLIKFSLNKTYLNLNRNKIIIFAEMHFRCC